AARLNVASRSPLATGSRDRACLPAAGFSGAAIMWVFWRAMAAYPQLSMLASARPPAVPRGSFAKMGHHCVRLTAGSRCTGAGLQSDRVSRQAPGRKITTFRTPGFSMNFRFLTRIVPVPVRSGWLFRGAPIAAVVLFGFSFLAAQAQDTTTSQHLPSARKAYKLGQRAEARQDYDAAFLNYQQAYKQNPADLRYRTAYDRVRVTDAAMHVIKGRALLKTGNTKGALVEFLHATEIAQMRERETGAPPPQSGLSSSQSEQQKIASLGTPPTLSPISNEPLTLHM